MRETGRPRDDERSVGDRSAERRADGRTAERSVADWRTEPGVDAAALPDAVPDGGSVESATAVLESTARSAYRFFEAFETDVGLIPDNVVLDDGDVVERDDRTSPSNVAMAMLSTVAADELGVLDTDAAVSRLRTTLETLADAEKWNGLFYRWYDARDGSLAVEEKDRHISTVDNGHLTASFAVVAQAYPELHDLARSLLEAGDYSSFLSDDGLLLGAYYFDRDGEGPGFGDWTYDQINSEPRVASYCAIGKGDFPKTHWWKPNRTFVPGEREAQQTAEGVWRSYDGVDVFEGRYEYDGVRFVPSWGGALFESLMASLFVKEKELSPGAWARNNYNHVRVHVEYADEQGWPAWGLSSCGLPDGYGTFGVPHSGEWDGRYQAGPWITPHAVCLGAMYDEFAAADAIAELRALGADGPYGLYDSVDAETGQVTEKYYSLDQGMCVAGLTNAITDGALREYFHEDPMGARPEDLLKRETFSI